MPVDFTLTSDLVMTPGPYMDLTSPTSLTSPTVPQAQAITKSDAGVVSVSEAEGLLAYLPPQVAGYLVLAAILVYGLHRVFKAEREDRKDLYNIQGELLAKQSARLDKMEAEHDAFRKELNTRQEELQQYKDLLAEVNTKLAAAEGKETECHARLGRLEQRYEARIKELMDEISELRVRVGDISEIQ